MTRFARGCGSKGSNEKVPERATSWKDMKRQLQESEAKQESSSTPARPSVHQLLNDDTSNTTTEWATFEDKKDKPANSSAAEKITKRSSSEKNDILSKTLAGKVKKSKKSKVKKNNIPEMLENNNLKHKVQVSSVKESSSAAEEKIKRSSSENNDVLSKTLAGKVKKSKKSKVKKNNIPEMLENNNLKHKVPVSSVKESARNSESRETYNNNINPVVNKQFKKKKLTKDEKIKSGKSIKRRKPALSTMVMAINGEEIPLTFFDGFIVKKEDADRFNMLRKKLTEKGVSKEEVRRVLKLERRKAEKALARERKKVCFQCRNSGHNLSECPELDVTQESTGICYKCGSTEHRSFECRVGKSSQYRFAKCFVCSEQGHISAQCPQNSKGLYPKGGSCHVCGDVSHLKKDCPKLERELESQGFTVDKINYESLEALDGKIKSTLANNVKKSKQATHVRF